VKSNKLLDKVKLSLYQLYVQILKKYVGYFDGEYYTFNYEGGEIVLKPVEQAEYRRLITIVSRKHYQESSEVIPVIGRAEINKALALKKDSGSLAFYQIRQTDNHNSYVNYWKYTKADLKGTILLPETLLLGSKDLNKNVIHVKQHNKSIYVTEFNKQIFSAQKSLILSSSKQFLMSIGAPPKSELVVETEYPTVLASGLRKSFFSAVFTFMPSISFTRIFEVLKPSFLLISGALSLYLLISSGYLLVKSQLLERDIESLSSTANTAIANRNSFEQKNKQLAVFNERLAAINSVSKFWLAIEATFSLARYSNIRFIDGRFVLRGKTEKATQIIDMLTTSSYVKDVKFDNPVRKQRNEESFVISFILVEGQQEQTQLGGEHD